MAYTWLIIALAVLIIVVTLVMAGIAGFRQNNLEQKNGSFSRNNTTADLTQEAKDMTAVFAMSGITALLLFIFLLFILWSKE